MPSTPFIIIDLFCGGGGCTVGFEQATVADTKVAKVVAALNHDPIAIASHAANHPDALHMEADIRKVDVRQLPRKKEYAGSLFVVHASLECTNFSNAKGGMPRDEDSRTLAWEMPRFIEWCRPDYVTIENVREFMSWGPLDENGKPLSKDKGDDYLKWIAAIEAMGYTHHFRMLNAADYGAHTSRVRYFAIFARKGMPVAWPQPTHARRGVRKEARPLFDTGLQPWKPVREVLDLADYGKSIFGREKPLVERTLKRILAGLNKYVANGELEFITKWRGHKGQNMNGAVSSTSDSSPVVTTMNHLGLAQPVFIQKWHGGRDAVHGMDEVCPALTTQRDQGLVQCAFLGKYHGQGENLVSPDGPASTVSTKDRMSMVNVQWLDKQYNGAHNHQPTDVPAGTVCVTDKHAQVTAQQYLLNPQYENPGNSIDQPCPVILACSDKKPLSLVSAAGAVHSPHWEPQPGDSETLLAIRAFMRQHLIGDILMRMLKVPELMRITGFPEGYTLLGSATKQKWMIGNAQPPIIPQRLIEALYNANLSLFPLLNPID